MTAPPRVSGASPVRGRVRLCQSTFPWRHASCARFISKSGRTFQVPKSQARLEEVLARRRAATKPVADIEAFGQVLHALFSASETEVVGDDLARFDINAPVVGIDGVPHHQVLRSGETYRSAEGSVRIERSLYSTRPGGERALCPMELRRGMVEGLWTRLAAMQATWVVARLTPQDVEQLFSKLGSMSASMSSLDQRRGVEKVIRAIVILRDRRPSVESCVEHAPSTPTRRRLPALSIARIQRPRAHFRSGSQNS